MSLEKYRVILSAIFFDLMHLTLAFFPSHTSADLLVQELVGTSGDQGKGGVNLH